ncbi:MAG: hypothetical protein ACLTLQ_03505 [[Clostridium] scindens]
MTFSGPTLRFEKDNIIATTGASMSPCVNGESDTDVPGGACKSRGNAFFGMNQQEWKQGLPCICRRLRRAAACYGKLNHAGQRNQASGGIEGRELEKGDSIGFVSPKTTEASNMADAVPLSRKVFPKRESDSQSSDRARNGIRIYRGRVKALLLVWCRDHQ